MGLAGLAGLSPQEPPMQSRLLSGSSRLIPQAAPAKLRARSDLVPVEMG